MLLDARIVSSSPRFSSISPALYQLHWLPVGIRTSIKVLLITLKTISGFYQVLNTFTIVLKLNRHLH